VPAVRITRACRDASTCGRGVVVPPCPRVRCAEQDDPYSPAQPHRDVARWPPGRLGISDVIADDALDPARRVDAEQRTGCTTGTLTPSDYRSLLRASGFTSIQITTTQDTEPGLRSALIQATRPG
jgi:hypothetical protein